MAHTRAHPAGEHAHAVRQMLYLAVDVEASGPSLKRNFMPCFGAAVVDTCTLEVVERFFTYVAQPAGATWDDKTLTNFWRTPKNRAWYAEVVRDLPRAPSVYHAMYDFYTFVRRTCGTHPAVVLSDTGGFDVAWLNTYLAKAECVDHRGFVLDEEPKPEHPIPASMNYMFGEFQPVRDTSSFHAGIGRCTPAVSLWGAEQCAYDALGVRAPELAVVHDHRPENDAAVIGLTAAYVTRVIESSDVTKYTHDEECLALHTQLAAVECGDVAKRARADSV